MGDERCALLDLLPWSFQVKEEFETALKGHKTKDI